MKSKSFSDLLRATSGEYSLKILIIESDAVSARQYRDFFKLHTIEAQVVSGAAEAIEAADEQHFDAVVVELQLIGHGGVEFLYEFRSYVDFDDIPVILYTAVPPERLPIHELKSRFNVAEVLYKPTATLAKLHRIIQKVAKK